MSDIDRAKKLVEEGSYEQAYEILEPLINAGDPESLFLFSSFSIDEAESIEEFESRSLAMIEAAAKGGLAEALYTLGVIYETGDGVKRDINHASSLYKQAAEVGHSRAKLSYGLDLYYGTNGIEKDEALGLSFIQSAVNEKVDGAESALTSVLNSDGTG